MNRCKKQECLECQCFSATKTANPHWFCTNQHKKDDFIICREGSNKPEWCVHTQEKLSEMLDILRKTCKQLYSELCDMLENGRLTEADIPDDFKALNISLYQCNFAVNEAEALLKLYPRKTTTKE